MIIGLYLIVPILRLFVKRENKRYILYFILLSVVFNYIPSFLSLFKNIMGFPKSFKVYMNQDEYLYWLNKARYTLAKGSVYQVGIWFKKCLKKALKVT